MPYDPTSTCPDEQYYAAQYEQQMLEWERQFELEELSRQLAEEEAEETGQDESNILSEEEAEKLINDYVRSDWSASRMEDLPF